MIAIKIFILIFMKACGGFYLSRLLYRRSLRILCYHGISIKDQHLFDDILFIRRETFERRIAIVKKWGMNVIPLKEAVEKLPDDKHPDHSVVITFDDGWYSTKQALPILKKYNYPSTLYLASYYALKGVNVFNVLIRYCFWKTKTSSLVIQKISPGLNGEYDLSVPENKDKVCKQVIAFGNQADLATKEDLTKNIVSQLGIDISEVERTRMFKYMSVEELNTLKEQKVSLELHTHRHDFPLDRDQVEKEISDNREILKLAGTTNNEHFCYPSGIYSEKQFSWLKTLGIKSATTTINNFNDSSTSLYKLNRFLDREKISDLEFEAEICGVIHLLRKFVLIPTPRKFLTQSHRSIS